MQTSDAILVITTGGTIDKTYFDALSKFQIEESSVSRLLETALVTHPFAIAELMRKDSLDLTDEDRTRLVAAVRQAESSRIVITHGTDTMTTSAEALATIEDKTIVLVGALKPARFQDSDAAFNLGMAFATAQIAPPGVFITMNGTVFPALKVAKDRVAGSFFAKARI